MVGFVLLKHKQQVMSVKWIPPNALITACSNPTHKCMSSSGKKNAENSQRSDENLSMRYGSICYVQIKRTQKILD